jgi:hypothetical protein
MYYFGLRRGSVVTACTFLIFAVAQMGVGIKPAQAWWKCSSGYTLKLKANNTKARCYRAAKTTIKSTRPCPKLKVPGTNVKVGSSKKKDYKGNKDKCVVLQSNFSVNTFCQPGYSLQFRSGWDKCRRVVPAAEKMVNKKTS